MEELKRIFLEEIVEIRKKEKIEITWYIIGIIGFIVLLIGFFCLVLSNNGTEEVNSGILIVTGGSVLVVASIISDKISKKNDLIITNFNCKVLEKFFLLNSKPYIVQDELYTENDIDNNKIFENLDFNRIFTQHKIISDDNKIVLSDLKLEKYVITIERLGHTYNSRHIPFPREKNTVMFDGVVLEYKEHFNTRNHKIFSKILDKYRIPLKVCIQSNKVSMLLEGFKVFDAVDFLASDEEILEKQFQSFKYKWEVIEEAIKELEMLKID